jgi:pre-mRNA-splicing helicase BRR2
MLRNPTLYGCENERTDTSFLQRRRDLAHSAASVLDRHGLIKYDRKTGSFHVTVMGRVASHYYVSHDSISVFNEYLKPTMNDIEIFRLFALSGEFKHIHVREEEKGELGKLMPRVPIPIKEGAEEPAAKVNVLLQAYISRLKLDGFALLADMTYIQQSACRLMRALFEVAQKKGWAALTTRVLSLCQMVERRSWGSQSPMRQFGAIPEIIVRKLEKNSDVGWERYYDLKPADLGEMVKIPKMGKTLYRYVHLFPKLALDVSVLPVTRGLLKMSLTITPGNLNLLVLTVYVANFSISRFSI